MNQQLNDDLKELPPVTRVTFRSYILAIIVLGGVISTLFFITRSDRSEEVNYLNQRISDQREAYRRRKTEDSSKIEKLESDKDSLQKLLYESAITRYNNKNETVTELKTLKKQLK